MILVQQFAVAILISACFGVGAVTGARPKGHPVHPQSRWRIYSPPDKSFRVAVPVTPHSEAEDYEGLAPSAPTVWKPTHSYMAVASILKPQIYSISVFEVTPAGRGATDKAIDELIQELTGNNYRLTTSKQLSVVQGRGREFTMASKDTDDNLFTRMRFIEVGARIYMLVYVTDTADDVYSRSASRFFSSFRAEQ